MTEAEVAAEQARIAEAAAHGGNFAELSPSYIAYHWPDLPATKAPSHTSETPLPV